ncbi:MAG: hypothetical protein QGG36_25155 [Pirellulaceae bacterium]|jgi:hypothetical protein|nr:hypothetical protein [Pirellulaceae bacterium]MDP7019110.1 hypothetical protein [Pirellulaceae bacterium]
MTSHFEELEGALASGGEGAVLDELIEQLRSSKQYHELFEALKMRARRQINLPLLYSDNGDELDESLREGLENGLFEACREVGQLLLSDGKVREGWMYLRPVGDREMAAQLIGAIEANDDNLDELVEVCLHEGVDAERGFRLVLDSFGTCNAITTFESLVHQRPKEELLAAAKLLVKHVHDELSATLRADIAQQEGEELADAPIADLVADRDWMFGEHSYHIDTTHLASTIRYARLLEDKQLLRLALDMTEYGRRLHQQFQYEGDEPFTDLYPSHALFFQALLGENVEPALEFFLDKAKTIDAYEFGAGSVETYIDLLARVGRVDDAIQALVELTPDNAHLTGQAPSLLELSQRAGDYSQFIAHCRAKNDLLGFATGLLSAGSN